MVWRERTAAGDSKVDIRQAARHNTMQSCKCWLGTDPAAPRAPTGSAGVWSVQHSHIDGVEGIGIERVHGREGHLGGRVGGCRGETKGGLHVGARRCRQGLLVQQPPQSRQPAPLTGRQQGRRGCRVGLQHSAQPLDCPPSLTCEALRFWQVHISVADQPDAQGGARGHRAPLLAAQRIGHKQLAGGPAAERAAEGRVLSAAGGARAAGLGRMPHVRRCSCQPGLHTACNTGHSLLRPHIHRLTHASPLTLLCTAPPWQGRRRAPSLRGTGCQMDPPLAPAPLHRGRG